MAPCVVRNGIPDLIKGRSKGPRAETALFANSKGLVGRFEVGFLGALFSSYRSAYARGILAGLEV
jgi:hypothetical protein